jgi:hypothetical protein
VVAEPATHPHAPAVAVHVAMVSGEQLVEVALAGQYSVTIRV